MKVIKYINESLLSDVPAEIHWSDYFWLYGYYSFIVLAPFILWLYIR